MARKWNTSKCREINKKLIKKKSAITGGDFIEVSQWKDGKKATYCTKE